MPLLFLNACYVPVTILDTVYISVNLQNGRFYDQKWRYREVISSSAMTKSQVCQISQTTIILLYTELIPNTKRQNFQITSYLNDLEYVGNSSLIKCPFQRNSGQCQCQQCLYFFWTLAYVQKRVNTEGLRQLLSGKSACIIGPLLPSGNSDFGRVSTNPGPVRVAPCA